MEPTVIMAVLLASVGVVALAAGLQSRSKAPAFEGDAEEYLRSLEVEPEDVDEFDQILAEHVAAERAQHQALEQRAARGDNDAADQRREPQVRYELEHGDADIGPEHEQRTMREIRDAHQPEDQ